MGTIFQDDLITRLGLGLDRQLIAAVYGAIPERTRNAPSVTQTLYEEVVLCARSPLSFSLLSLL